MLQLVDSRNTILGIKLSENHEPLVSTIFPDPSQSLPEEIKAALELYISNFEASPEQVQIFIEINHWMNKKSAITLLQHMHDLIDRFFTDCHKLKVSYQLSLYEKNEFTIIKPRDGNR